MHTMRHTTHTEVSAAVVVAGAGGGGACAPAGVRDLAATRTLVSMLAVRIERSRTVYNAHVTTHTHTHTPCARYAACRQTTHRCRWAQRTPPRARRAGHCDACVSVHACNSVIATQSTCSRKHTHTTSRTHSLTHTHNTHAPARTAARLEQLETLGVVAG
jgi:hypothetical protein